MAVAYTVRAELPDEAMRRAYIAWLMDGHVQEVCRLGPATATIITLDPEPGSPAAARAAEVRYLFLNRGALDRYLNLHAPRLRAEGLARFGPGTGVRFSRTIGDVAAAAP